MINFDAIAGTRVRPRLQPGSVALMAFVNPDGVRPPNISIMSPNCEH